jgi:hypothetical protein
MVKLHIRQSEDAVTSVVIIKHASASGAWDRAGGDFELRRDVNPDTGDHWWPVVEGVRLTPYLTFREDVGVEVYPSLLGLVG